MKRFLSCQYEQVASAFKDIHGNNITYNHLFIEDLWNVNNYF